MVASDDPVYNYALRFIRDGVDVEPPRDTTPLTEAFSDALRVKLGLPAEYNRVGVQPTSLEQLEGFIQAPKAKSPPRVVVVDRFSDCGLVVEATCLDLPASEAVQVHLLIPYVAARQILSAVNSASGPAPKVILETAAKVKGTVVSWHQVSFDHGRPPRHAIGHRGLSLTISVKRGTEIPHRAPDGYHALEFRSVAHVCVFCRRAGHSRADCERAPVCATCGSNARRPSACCKSRRRHEAGEGGNPPPPSFPPDAPNDPLAGYAAYIASTTATSASRAESVAADSTPEYAPGSPMEINHDPSVSESSSASETTSAPEATSAAEVSETSSSLSAPEVTSTPEVTSAAEVSETSSSLSAPEITSTPEVFSAAEVSETSSSLSAPEVTSTPEVISAVEVSETSSSLSAPEVTSTTEASATSSSPSAPEAALAPVAPATPKVPPATAGPLAPAPATPLAQVLPSNPLLRGQSDLRSPRRTLAPSFAFSSVNRTSPSRPRAQDPLGPLPPSPSKRDRPSPHATASPSKRLVKALEASTVDPTVDSFARSLGPVPDAPALQPTTPASQ